MPAMCLLTLPTLVAAVKTDRCFLEEGPSQSVHLLQARAAFRTRSNGSWAEELRSNGSWAEELRHRRTDSMLSTDAGVLVNTPEVTTVGLVAVAVAVFAGLASAMSVYVGVGPSTMDLFTWFSCTMAVLLTGIGIWGDMDGGRMPVNVWFGWHPVLMVLAFMCLMVLGRWSYATEFLLGSKDERRRVHRVVMLLAVVAMLFGYYAIFSSHWPVRKFFGYSFLDHEWAPWQRVAHVYLGYASVLLSFAQAAMGLLKYERLKTGEKSFTFHGTLGKLTIFLSGCAVIMAVWFWGWGPGLSALMGTSAALCTLLGTLWPAAPARSQT